MEFDSDIFISGAGIAGMILAARLAEKGYSVIICDPATPPEDAQSEGSDLRSTAYLEPSRQVMEDAGLWRALAPHATPLNALKVIDTDGWPPVERTRRTFHPRDLELSSFGQNIPNWRAHRVLMAHLETHDRIDLRLGTGFVGYLARDRDARVTLDDGTKLRVKLVIGADGRDSAVRRAAGISTRTRRYGQSAFAFAITHNVPHHFVSTEIYNTGGAFTTVPLADHDGRPASAIVWMNDGARARRIAAMDDGTFAETLHARSCGILGRMRPVTPVRSWPIITRTAGALTAKRCALVAEAAHVLPPIGAQGLNTSIADIAALTDVLGDDPGAPGSLDRYARARSRDIRMRATAIDLFNRVCKSSAAPVQFGRRVGLVTAHDIAPVRIALMRAGMGGAS